MRKSNIKSLFTKAVSGVVATALTASLLITTPVLAGNAATSAADVASESAASATYLSTKLSFDNMGSNFYNISKSLIFQLRAGIDCSALTEEYLKQVDALISEEGDLNISNTVSAYAMLNIVLALTDHDATDYNGVNLVAKYEEALNAMTDEDLSKVNPYILPIMYSSAKAFEKDFTDGQSAVLRLKKAILTYADDNGIQYWGSSTDNNGFALSEFASAYGSDDELTAVIDKALAYNKTRMLSDGTFKGESTYSDYANADSTAGGLALLAAAKKLDDAELAYKGLLTYKCSETPGSFIYISSDPTANDYATNDAMYALLTYQRALSGTTGVYDVSDTNAVTYRDLIALIDTLPDTITLDNGDLIKEIGSTYEALPEVFKAKITNYSKYSAALEAYNKLIKDSKEPETDAPADNPSKPAADKPADTPDTADRNNTAMYLTILLASLGCSVALTATKRRKQDA